MSAHAIRPRAESGLIPAAVTAGVLAAAAAGWVVLARRMTGMDMARPTGMGMGGMGMTGMAMTPATHGGDPGPLGWFAVTWVVMTAAMMLPGSAPAVLDAVRGRRGGAAATAGGFVTAYGAVWLLAGLLGYACVQAVRALDISALSWSSGGRYLAAATVIAAGIYQLTPIKRRWLARCVAPERHAPGEGVTGTLRAGVRYGVCCVACCGTLMVALYALGLMSVAWMVVVTVLIAGERLLARTQIAVAAVAAVAAVLVVVGLGLATVAS